MSYFVYVSHRDLIHALNAARDLMDNGHFPFIPQLNKLVPNRKDAEWENYYKMWIFRCDMLLKTESFRQHEVEWAEGNKIPVVCNIRQVNEINMERYEDLGERFGKAISAKLPPGEPWRRQTVEDVEREWFRVAGIGTDPIGASLLALKLWDRRQDDHPRTG